MITIVSCSHYPDDERIYHKEIKTLAEKKYSINYFTRSESEQNLSDEYINHINYSSAKHTIKDYMDLVKIEIRRTSTRVIHIQEPELFSLAVNIKKMTGAKIIYDVHEDYISMIYTFSKWNKFIKYIRAKYWLLKEKYFYKRLTNDLNKTLQLNLVLTNNIRKLKFGLFYGCLLNVTYVNSFFYCMENKKSWIKSYKNRVL